MPDKTVNQSQDNKNQTQDQKLSSEKNQVLPENNKSDFPESPDVDGDEDENHYNDQVGN
jgi:hypothetical protein